jgi:hypothetical protein
MRQLKWSKNTAGTLNGKVGHVTLYTVAYYPERWYFVAPKLPGLTRLSWSTMKKQAKGGQRHSIYYICEWSRMVSRA